MLAVARIPSMWNLTGGADQKVNDHHLLEIRRLGIRLQDLCYCSEHKLRSQRNEELNIFPLNDCALNVTHCEATRTFTHSAGEKSKAWS